MVHCISIFIFIFIFLEGGGLKNSKVSNPDYHAYNHVTIISCEYQGQMKQVLLIIVRNITFSSRV